MATHSSVLAWRIPGTEGAWWEAIYGFAQSPTRLSDFTFTFSFRLSHKASVYDVLLLLSHFSRVRLCATP